MDGCKHTRVFYRVLWFNGSHIGIVLIIPKNAGWGLLDEGDIKEGIYKA